MFAGFLLLLVVAACYAPVWYDDAGHYIVIRELIGEGVACYPVELNRGECDPYSPFITMGPALNYPLGSWMRIVGTEMQAGRALMVILSLQAMLAFLVLARKVVQARKAFWAMALVVGNIQLVTYGAEILGEVPMLGWLFLALAFQLRAWREGKIGGYLLAAASMVLAILTKEYIAAPLALGMAAWIVYGWATRGPRQALALLGQGLLIALTIGGYHLWQTGSLEALTAWFQVRSSYGSEFLSFDLGESLRFLLFKPLILLGTIALWVKVSLRRAPIDVLIACFHGAHLLFFLSSAGYDRFGFQLLFIPAIYFSEFVAAAWERYCSKTPHKTLRKAAFLLVFLLLFTQQTLPLMAGRLFSAATPNQNEKTAVSLLVDHRVNRIFTYDQQLIPFLPAGYQFRLSPTVPSNAQDCKPLQLKTGEWLVAGTYARTEFQMCVDWKNLERVDSTGTGPERYVFLRHP